MGPHLSASPSSKNAAKRSCSKHFTLATSSLTEGEGGSEFHATPPPLRVIFYYVLLYSVLRAPYSMPLLPTSRL